MGGISCKVGNKPGVDTERIDTDAEKGAQISIVAKKNC